MAEIKEPIAPPQEESSTGIQPIVSVAPPKEETSRPVSTVNISYPQEFKQLVVDMQNTADPQARVRVAETIEKVTKETEGYRPNMRPQWDKVAVSILTGRLGDALKYYNGGAVTEEKGVDINNNIYFKVNNEIGWTGVYKDSKGRVLSPKEVEELQRRGGVFTKTDKDSLETSTWANLKNTQEAINQGLTSQLAESAKLAYATAKDAGASSQNVQEQLDLASRIKGVLNHIGTLDPQRRQKLLGYINRFNNLSNSLSGETAKGGTVGSLDSTGQTRGFSAGGSLNAGRNQDGMGLAPPGYGGAGNVGMSTTNQALNQAQVTENERNVNQRSKSDALQEQQNLQSMIMQELQGVIKSPQEFYDLTRLQALDLKNKASYANIPAAAKAPGFAEISEDDPVLSGFDNTIANRVTQLRNNALMAAWTETLYDATRKAAKSGNILEAGDLNTLTKKFKESDIFKAINNTYRGMLQNKLTDQMPQFQPGELLVDKNNNIIRYKGAK